MQETTLADTPALRQPAGIEYSQSRLGDLVELALDHDLVDSCNVTKDLVLIAMCGHTLTFARNDARSFLSSLMQGWTRSQSPAPSVQPAPDVRRRTIFNPLPANTAGQSGLTSSPGEARADAPTDEDYVDAVLSCAEKLNLIESFNKDRSSHRVTLQTKATTTDMSYYETLEYLTGSILEELRVGSRAGSAPAS